MAVSSVNSPALMREKMKMRQRSQHPLDLALFLQCRHDLTGFLLIPGLLGFADILAYSCGTAPR